MVDRRVEIRRATPADVEILARTMRDADKREVLALGHTPRHALEMALRTSVGAYVGIGNDEVQAMLGVGTYGLLSDVGIPWMLSAEGIDLWSKSVGLESVKFHRVLKQRFRRLENIVHAENESAINWLRWLGYTIEEPVAVPPYGAKFCRFWMEC